jgi:hypothetical protein
VATVKTRRCVGTRRTTAQPVTRVKAIDGECRNACAGIGGYVAVNCGDGVRSGDTTGPARWPHCGVDGCKSGNSLARDMLQGEAVSAAAGGSLGGAIERCEHDRSSATQ